MRNNMRKLRKLMWKNLRESYRGWWIWHKIVKKYKIKNTAVILLPSLNISYNYNALLYLNQMLKQHNYNNAIILTLDPIVLKAASVFSENILAVKSIKRIQAERLMQFYCLYDFDPRFIVASLEEPEGRNAHMLVGKHGTTVAELIAIGVYQIPKFKRELHPIYTGNDHDIKKFITEGEES